MPNFLKSPLTVALFLSTILLLVVSLTLILKLSKRERFRETASVNLRFDTHTAQLCSADYKIKQQANPFERIKKDGTVDAYIGSPETETVVDSDGTV